jgi:hypothetical protein
VPAEVIASDAQPLLVVERVWTVPDKPFNEDIPLGTPIQTPFIAKHPFTKSIPLEKLEVADVEVTRSNLVDIPHVKVEVALAEETVIDPEVEAFPERDKSTACTVPVAKSPPTVEVPDVRELPWIAREVEVPAEVVPIWKLPPVMYEEDVRVIAVPDA